MKLTMQTSQTLIGLGTLALGAAMAFGAWSIRSDAGYAGVGPNFLPWVVSIALMVFGAWLAWESRTGGFRFMDEASGAERADWGAFVWVSVAILANAALITTIGFILSCTLLFMLAVRGFKSAEVRMDKSLGVWVKDAAIGFAISAAVYWVFTKLLAINLPGLTTTGWL